MYHDWDFMALTSQRAEPSVYQYHPVGPAKIYHSMVHSKMVMIYTESCWNVFF